MSARNKPASSRDGGFSDFFWNIVGGAMVAAMLAGVVYLVVGMIGSYFTLNDKYWELVYLKWYFIVIFAVYIVVPKFLANVVMAPFKSNSKSRGKQI